MCAYRHALPRRCDRNCGLYGQERGPDFYACHGHLDIDVQDALEPVQDEVYLPNQGAGHAVRVLNTPRVSGGPRRMGRVRRRSRGGLTGADFRGDGDGGADGWSNGVELERQLLSRRERWRGVENTRRRLYYAY